MVLDDFIGLRSYRPCSITIASPGVITSEGHGLCKNDKVVFSTTGTLPTGITEGVFYFVILGTYSDGTTDPDTFKIAASKNGTAINTSGSQAGAQYFDSPSRHGLKPAYQNNK